MTVPGVVLPPASDCAKAAPPGKNFLALGIFATTNRTIEWIASSDTAARNIRARTKLKIERFSASLPVNPLDEPRKNPSRMATNPFTTVSEHVSDGASRCYLPSWLDAQPIWGITLQLYEVRSNRNWGVGDFCDLMTACDIAAEAGADFVGLNPLHALFMADPERCSPFSPSSRRFLNPIYIAVDEVEGYIPSDAVSGKTRTLRETDIVDYREVAALKMAVLRRIWTDRAETQSSGTRDAFRRFCEEKGEPLRLHALFEALSMEMVARGFASGWRDWPEEYRHPETAAVDDYARDHTEEVDFHRWLQWLCEEQLAQAAGIARRAGMRVGLYLDFAVGEAPDGSATWTDQNAYVIGKSVGAPPDWFSAYGQDWGLTPLSPDVLAATGCAAFAASIEASMRHAGAVRIDHAMALQRLFFIPEGHPPAEGEYVDFPFEQLMRTLADLSHERRTIVIGEDLGVVPPGFRDRMEEWQVLSYRIAYFEKKDRDFIRPKDYPPLSIACLSTHDLPPLRAWWRGDAIRLRQGIGAIDENMADGQARERAVERIAIMEALRDAGAASDEEIALFARSIENPEADLPLAFWAAMHRFLALTPSHLTAVRLADLTGEDRPTNVPGTVESYPNWRFKAPVPLEDLSRSELFRAITGAVAQTRPRPA